MSTAYKPTSMTVYVDGKEFQVVQFPCRWEVMASKFDWSAIIAACENTCDVSVEYDDGHSIAIASVKVCGSGCLVNIAGSTPIERVPMAAVWPTVRLFISCAVLRNELELTVADDGIKYLKTPRMIMATPRQ